MDFDQNSASKPQDIEKETLTRSPCSRSPSPKGRGLGKLNEAKPNLAGQGEGINQEAAVPSLKPNTPSSCGLSTGSQNQEDTAIKSRYDEKGEGVESDDDRHTPLLKYANELGKQQTLENKKNRQRQWTKEKRQKRSAQNHDEKPWQYSTGPKTTAGKAKSAKNAYQHGFRSQDYSEILKLLKLQRESVKRLNADIWGQIHLMQLDAKHAKRSPMKMTISHMITKLRQMAPYNEVLSAQERNMILSHVTGFSTADFITKADETVSQDQQDQIYAIADRVVAGEPLTRVLGVREFWGLEFEVTPAVLDPRADTETLIDAVLKFAKTNVIARSEASLSSRKRGKQSSDGGSRLPRSVPSLAMTTEEQPIKILDLGTGTGCIPIVLLTEFPNATAIAVDISAEALDVARRNAARHGVEDRTTFIQGDWFDALAGHTPNVPFDIITSNPPYIADAVIPELDENVKNHDPILALSGGESGLEAYKKIILGLKNYLNGQNRAFLEIGFDQLESVSRLVDDSKLSVVAHYQDLGGNPRVVEVGACASGDK